LLACTCHCACSWSGLSSAASTSLVCATQGVWRARACKGGRQLLGGHHATSASAACCLYRHAGTRRAALQTKP
jgi:hypothetical protein